VIPVKRSLVLAGGGAKIGWASGALQVLMEDGGLTFDHIDATSGSVFNLGMLLSGRSPAQIAAAWADLSPWEFVSFHPLRRYVTFWRLPSLLTQDAAVRRILPKWGIDVAKIRGCTHVNGHPVTATFNVLDFGAKRIKTIPHTEMDLEYLLAVDAVPGVVPPIAKDGTLYTDAMLLKDANLGEAVRQGADEIWVIWTVEDRAVWRGGFWNHFGHIFETCAVGNLKRELDAIEDVNRRVADGTAEPGRRHVTVRLLSPERPVPVDYLFFRNKKQMAPTIEAGRADARRYLARIGHLPGGGAHDRAAGNGAAGEAPRSAVWGR
jgi:predicted patatin/cPLA2 family phospholipase